MDPRNLELSRKRRTNQHAHGEVGPVLEWLTFRPSLWEAATGVLPTQSRLVVGARVGDIMDRCCEENH